MPENVFRTPRSHSQEIGGVDSAKMSGNGPAQGNPKGSDPADKISQRERLLFDKMPPQVPPKPFR